MILPWINVWGKQIDSFGCYLSLHFIILSFFFFLLRIFSLYPKQRHAEIYHFLTPSYVKVNIMNQWIHVIYNLININQAHESCFFFNLFYFILFMCDLIYIYISWHSLCNLYKCHIIILLNKGHIIILLNQYNHNVIL